MPLGGQASAARLQRTPNHNCALHVRVLVWLVCVVCWGWDEQTEGATMLLWVRYGGVHSCCTHHAVNV
jgi:hypothetical protein